MALKSNLGIIAAGMEGAIDRGVETTANQIATLAQSYVPVDTGALRTSIEVFGAGGSMQRTVEAGQSLDYAQFVEYGSANQAAQPFMTPAAEQLRPVLPINIANEIKKLAKAQKKSK